MAKSMSGKRICLLVMIGCVSATAVVGLGTAARTASQPSPAALNEAGLNFLNSGKLDRALADFLAAEQQYPKNADIAFNVGLTYVRMGRYKDAIVPLRRAASDPNTAVKTAYLLGVSLYESGNFKAAATELEPLREQASGHQDEILYLLEESYRRGRNAAKAKNVFTELMSRYPNSALVHKLMGVAYDEQGDSDQSLAEFKEAVRIDPRLQDAHLAIGILYMNKHEDEEAIPWLQQELALNQCQAAAHYYLGEIDRRAAHAAAALIQYRRALACDSTFPDAYLGLGLLFEAEGQDTNALAALRTAASLAPDNLRIHYQLAHELDKNGKRREAREEFQRVRTLSAIANEKSVQRIGMSSGNVKVGAVVR